jgi:hypothetical protein
MKATKQIQAADADLVRAETLTFRLSKRLRSLAEVGAHGKGVSLANYVETALAARLSEPLDDLNGSSVLAMEEKVYDDDDARCFLKRLRGYSWALNSKQLRILELVQTSPILNPSKGSYNDEVIRQHWSELQAISDGDISTTLPAKMFHGVDVEFAIMSEKQRMKLYHDNPEEFTRRSQAHLKATKGKKVK